MSLITAINTLFNHPGLRRFFVRARAPLGLLALLAALTLIRPSGWFWGGMAVSLAGATAQAWCFGCIMTSQELAVNGHYRFVRNPMYVGMASVLLGEALAFASWILLAYALIVVSAFIAFVHLYEEPGLQRKFGKAYEDYCRQVGRWLPKPPSH